MAYLGALRYGFPSKKIIVIGITGTKGKTSSVELVSAVLRAGGKKVASLSSLQISIDMQQEKNKTGNSMPGQFFIQEFLHDAVSAGCTHAVIEVTSQGAAMHRHRGIRWLYGGLTNLSPEHIDWHGSYEKYRDAKLLFLSAVAKAQGMVFLNAHDNETPYYRNKLTRIKKDCIELFDGDDVRAMVEGNQYFVGVFAKENAALAVKIAMTCGISQDDIKKALQEFKGVEGRFEYVQREPYGVIVDYAHTPDSLLALYTTIRPEANRMICVLGSAGGGRDVWKRAKMGEIAAQFCDTIYLTNEDPYNEDPQEIIDGIEAGVPQDKKERVVKVLDRKEALRLALLSAGSGDCVVATGKGSEEYIHEAQGKVRLWNERKTIEELLVGLQK